MKDLTKEQVYKKIKLTSTQLKAWNELMIAFKKCEKSGIVFYNCQGDILPMNGKNVIDVETAHNTGLLAFDPLCPQCHILPCYHNPGLSGLADDIHKIILKE